MIVTVFYDPAYPIYSHNANLKHLETVVLVHSTIEGKDSRMLCVLFNLSCLKS